MYDMIGRVYHSSKGEVACLVKDECYLTNTEFFGNEETENEVSTLTNDEILTLWEKLFNIWEKFLLMAALELVNQLNYF